MAVNYQAALKRAFQEIQTTTIEAFDEAPTVWPEYASEMPSGSRSTIHAWLGNQANVREWLGSRIAHGLSTRTWEIVNRKWELTYKFERDQVEDDLEGLGASAVTQARGMGKKFAKHEDKLIADTLAAGTSKLCWDGQFFFDTDHPFDVDGLTSGTYSNSFTLALSHANYRTVLTAAESLKGEDGMPINAMGEWILMVPPALRLEGEQIVKSPYLTPAAAIGLFGTSGQSPNPYVGSARLVVNPFLTSTTRWYLMNTGEVVKPLILQRRRPLEITETDESAMCWFEEEIYYIGGSARYAASYALPQLAFTSAP